MKEAYYFSHDANAQDDEKIMNMMAEHDWAGYGIYWGIVEKLRSATDYKFRIDSLKGVAHKMRIQIDVLKSIVFDFDLFANDGEYFWSESLNRRMALRDEKIEQARTAGQRSGEARRTKMNDRSTDVQQTFNDRSTDAEQLKERKRKEINTHTHTIGDEERILIQFSIQEANPELTVPEAKIEANKMIAFFSERGWTYSNGLPVENLAAAAANWTVKVKSKNGNHGTNGNKPAAGKFEPVAKLLAEVRELKGI